MQESKTGMAGVGHVVLTNRFLQVCELVGVFAVGASAILVGVATFGRALSQRSAASGPPTC